MSASDKKGDSVREKQIQECVTSFLCVKFERGR